MKNDNRRMSVEEHDNWLDSRDGWLTERASDETRASRGLPPKRRNSPSTSEKTDKGPIRPDPWMRRRWEQGWAR